MARSSQKTIYGSSTPRIASPLLRGLSLGQLVSDLADDLGQPLLEWQKYVLNDALTIDEEGLFQRKTIGVCVARQQGKTHLMRLRILAGLFIFGEKNIIAMAQNRQLALDTFKEVVELAESKDYLRKRIKRVSRTNGQEELEVYCHHYPKDCTDKHCNRIRKYGIRAATSEGSRGASADLLYVDELREISPSAWTAATPITRSRKNSQIWITTNAGDATSEVLNDLRSRALLFESPRLGWYEWSAEPNSRIDDVKAWQAANPALGYITSLEALQDAAARDTPDAVRTEMLCMWVSSISSPFPFQVWDNCTDPDLKLQPNLETYMGLDLNFMRTDAFLITVQRREEKLAVFLTHWHNPDGLNDVALTGDLAELARKYRTRALAFDPKTAGHIAPQLARVGIPVAPTTWASTQFSIFCDSALSAMTAGRLVHTDQDLLNRHLQATARRPSSDGGWRIARSASVQDIGAAVALVMAVGHAEAPQAQVSVSVV